MKEKRKINNSGRVALIIISGAFLSLFVAVGYFFGSISITGQKNGHNLLAMALSDLVVNRTVRGSRGDIRDRNGSIIATQETSFLIFANKNPDWGSYIQDYAQTARQLSTVLAMGEEAIYDRLRSDAYHIEFGIAGRQLTVRQRNQILAMEIPGIDFQANTRRSYPNGVFASHTIGYAQMNDAGTELHGVMGIEEYFDDALQGTEGAIAFLQDRHGRLQPNRDRITTQQFQDGYNIYLTIDSGIQLFLEQALDHAWETAQPQNLVAIVANPVTGELYAMGNRSTFDPNTREDIGVHFNPLIFDAFEPGSTMKVFTYAAAIEEGNYVGHQRFQSGSVALPFGGVINDWRPEGWGSITFDEGFYVSANTGIVHMLNNWITPERNLEFFQAFGFGQNTGIQLFNENPGMLPFNQNLLQQYNAAFGQGLTTTPIQHIQAITAILNEGQMLRPQIVSSIVDPNTDTVVFEPGIEVVGEPISAETARQVMDLMIGVVENPLGTGGAYSLGEISSGGKTGTAQIPDGPAGYLVGEYLFSYVGFAPADNPRLVMYLAISQPTYGDGHTILSEIYRFVMNQSLAYLGMSRQERVELQEVHELAQVESVLNLSPERAVEAVEALGLEAVVIGNGDQVFAQLPEAGTLTVAGSLVFLQTEALGPLPDFTGWTRSEVTQFRLLTGQTIQLEGNGLVVGQSHEEGELLPLGEPLILTLHHIGAEIIPDREEENLPPDH